VGGVIVHDISVPIRPGMVIYDGNPGVNLERASDIEAGARSNISRLDLGVHTGTHVDAPLHFSSSGAGTESLALEPLIGPAVVVDATAVVGKLDRAALEPLAIPAGTERVLLKTTNGRLWDRDVFSRDFIRLTGDGAQFLVDRDVRVVGIDFLSIGDGDAHRVLLDAGVIPIEGLDLRRVEPGTYEFVCLPLRLVGSDGAPARAVLIAA
jgi:arylformamidase